MFQTTQKHFAVLINVRESVKLFHLCYKFFIVSKQLVEAARRSTSTYHSMLHSLNVQVVRIKQQLESDEFLRYSSLAATVLHQSISLFAWSRRSIQRITCCNGSSKGVGKAEVLELQATTMLLASQKLHPLGFA